METIFKDLKVIELANVLAGPAAGLFFAELGAEVIKIENKLTGGDVTRSWKLPQERNTEGISAYYASVNWQKQTIYIDMNDPADKHQVLELVKTADIVISNYKPGDDRKLGMDYSSLKKIKPDLIYACLTGFGTESKRTAYDLVLQAESGFMHLNGTPESGPLKMPVALIDVLAAHQLKEGILVALIRRLKTSQGSEISVSLFDSAIASLANRASNYLMAQHNPGPEGSLHPNIAPYGETFLTADARYLVLAVGDNKQFEKLCTVLQLDELPQDDRFRTNINRVDNRTALFELMQNSISRWKAEELMRKLLEKQVPAGLVKSIKEVLDQEAVKGLILQEGETRRVKTAVFNIR